MLLNRFTFAVVYQLATRVMKPIVCFTVLDFLQILTPLIAIPMRSPAGKGNVR